MALISLYLDTRREKKDGLYPLKVNIRHNGKFLLSTGFSVAPDKWTGSGFTNKVENYKTKNASLRKLLNDIENTIFRLDMDGKLKNMPDKVLKGILEKCLPGFVPEKTKLFIDYLSDFIDLKEKPGTKTVYTTTLNKILEFDRTCTFDTMTLDWLRRFEKWMKDSGMKTNAYAIHLRNIRAVFNYAIDEEITTLYPFRKFKIKKEETAKRCLTPEQVALLRDYGCEEHQKRYRDIFMLMLYLIGINAVDLFNLKQLVNGRIEYNRAKTGKLYSIKVEPEAMEIIERYKGDNWLLNVLDTYSNYRDFLHRMDVGLKQIGPVVRKGLGGRKEREPLFPDISSYWARHTWATIAAGLDIPKETISAALGHEIGSDVTSIYIRFDQRKIDEANRKVIDCIEDVSRWLKLKQIIDVLLGYF
ncbi:recombinase [Bacteroides salyersiae]|uniref:site-specific integrase n=1 Tax=Bacteroides salyersiae TaxID=291644 RepID=UPI001B8B77F8|nr:site-specific integrase [Bacteroides salyersiae]MBT9871951.1 recombinase [Bacteroides salyersiae]QUT76128.1 Phage integrase SAM-like domain protein [Bacteroides salyersiae]